MDEPKVVFSRGGLPESEHLVAWCVTSAGGGVQDCGGDDGSLAIFPRSAVKPFQALPGARAGVLERFGLDDRHLALACASHGGAPGHSEVVTEILAACRLGEGDLGCGPMDPREPAAAASLRARGEHATRVNNNCSGKHALALALCVQEGWPIDDYLELGHPLQQAMHAAVAEAAGREPDTVPHGTDGCGMPTFHLPMSALASAFGRLAAGGLGPAGDRIARAMRAHPDLVAYPGAVDTELMRACDGLVAKVGAEGVLAVGLADGRGLALKVRDGAMRAMEPAGVAAVREKLGVAAVSGALDRLGAPQIANSRGEYVGEGASSL